MMKHILSPLALTCTLAAQAYFIPSDTPTVGTCNVIPFGDSGTATWSNQVYQTVATATDLGVHRNSRLRITLSHVPANYTLQAAFAANLPNPVVVLDATNYVWSITANQWNEVGIQVPFLYDGVSDVVMEVLTEGNTNTGSIGMHRDVRPRAYATGWPTGSPPATGTVATGALKWRLSRCLGTLGYFGEGCGGLSHTYTGVPQLGATTLDANLAGCAPTSPAFLIIGTTASAPFPIDLSFLGMTGCRLYQNIVIVVSTSSDGSGNATIPLGPVPSLLSWCNAQLFTQGANLNTGAPGNVTTSNYARLVFGN
jgi:hypothetical protein